MPCVDVGETDHDTIGIAGDNRQLWQEETTRYNCLY